MAYVSNNYVGPKCTRFFKEPAQGLVPKVPYFWTSNSQIVVIKVL